MMLDVFNNIIKINLKYCEGVMNYKNLYKRNKENLYCIIYFLEIYY